MIAGLRVGHWTDRVTKTGCTVVLPPPGTIASGEVRGGAPGTRETDLLQPGRLVQEVHAVLLTGGSAYGLAAADGVMRWLEERGIGFEAELARVPIVPAAVVFDLGVGDPSVRPGSAEGYQACQAASDDDATGKIGAGTGCTVGLDRVPGGLGTAEVSSGGATVWALAVVNAFGAIVDEDGRPLAGEVPPPDAVPVWPGANTVLGVVATDAVLTKRGCWDLAAAGHAGLARAVRPAHTMWDGDTVFTLATGQAEAPPEAVERIAGDAMAEAIRRAVAER
ncbi:MAG TPA: P1 family peptidase [Actinomycetota bacterium]|nr:P1 family peptidase [Actinomycetota bacterium]